MAHVMALVSYWAGDAMGGEAPPDIERMGVSAAGLAFSSLGWAFRSQEVKDYGIDAHVEPFSGPHLPTGRLLALQVKAGGSYFQEEDGEGWWYRGTNRHLRYWLGHVLPVIIVMYDDEDRILYWQHVTEDRIEYTDRGWKILVPRVQVVSAGAAGQLRAIAESATGASENPVADSLRFLPPSAAAVLSQVQAAEPDGTMRLARLLARGRDQPRLTVETVLAAQPSWLPAGNGRFEAAIGAYANEHDLPDLALEAFTRAAGYESADAGRLNAAAAVLALGQGDVLRAGELVRQAEDHGDEGLLLSIARAALADHEQGADMESPRVAEILSTASKEDLAAEPTVVVLLGVHAARRGDFTEAVRLFEAAATGKPPLAVARLQLAHALIAQAAGGGSVVAARDRLRAQELAREVQLEVRQWSGPSEKALSVLLKAHLIIGAFKEMVRLATPESLGGAALDREASFGEVAVAGAEAAVAMRDRPRAASFAGLVTGTSAEVFIRALALDASVPVTDQAAAWRDALASAITFEQQRGALYHFAALGELQAADLAAGTARHAIDEIQAEVLSARCDAARGEVEPAVMRLRRHADTNSAAAEMLVEVLVQAGRTDEALAECDRAVNRFGAGTIAHDKLNILAQAGRIDEADAFAIRLLAGPDLAAEQRVTLRQRLIHNSADGGDWRAAEDLCREALAESPDDPGFLWGLITAQANQGHLDQAWSTYRQLHPPVAAPELTELWMALHSRFGFTGEDVATALDFIDRWPDSPDVGGRILTAFLELGGQQRPDGKPVLPDLSPETLGRFQAELKSYALRNPGSALTMIDLGDVDLVQVIRAQLVPHAGDLNRAADLVREGRLPLGALAVAASRPYAAMLIELAVGMQYAVTADSTAFQQEAATARRAVNGEVVTEASALAVATVLPGRWPALRAAFSTVRLPRPALVDIDQARKDLARIPGSTYSVGYDPQTDTLVLREVSLAEHQHLHGRGAALDEAARQLTITDLPAETGAPNPHQAWSSAITLAAQRRLPLWSDDVAVRSVAASRGVSAFGTYALLAALTEAGLIPDTKAEDTLALAKAHVVCLPDTRQR
jgi:tetratricopeptide (TPR) repeat protein